MELIGAQMKYSVVRTMFYECDLPSCTKRYFKFPCAEHSDEPLKAEKETFHISFVRLCGRLLKKFNRTIQNKNDLIQQTDSEVFTNIKI